MRAVRIAALLVPLVSLGLAGCGAIASRDRPNILLVSMDSLREDHADGVSSKTDTGPHLAKLAAGGTVFTAASSTAPWTTPSMMSVLTGLYPWSHHVRDHNFTLSPEVPLLAERLKAIGYATGAVVPSATLREDFGFNRGFDFFSNGRYGHDVVTSPAMTGEALNWLSQQTGGPFFLWIHYWDPHYNYLPPAPYDHSFDSGWKPPSGVGYNLTVLKNTPWAVRPEEAKFLEAQYRGELLYTDKYLGDLLGLLDEKGLTDRTLVVVIGDHGEAFQEHGWLTHTMTVYEEMTHVPIVLRWPGKVPAGRRVEAPVSLVNLAPTLLDYAGAPPPGDAMEGRSLRALVEGGAPPELPPVVAETIRQQSRTSLKDGRWKYILDMDSCKGELYDLSADPAEGTDLSTKDAAEAARLRSALLAFYADRPLASRIPVVRTEERQDADTQLLRSLGYIATDRFGDAITYSGKTDPSHCH